MHLHVVKYIKVVLIIHVHYVKKKMLIINYIKHLKIHVKILLNLFYSFQMILKHMKLIEIQ